MNREQLAQALENESLTEVLAKLEPLAQRPADQKELTLLRARCHRLNRDNRVGVIKHEDSRTETAQLNRAVLEFGEGLIGASVVSQKEKKNRRLWLWVVLLTGTLATGWWLISTSSVSSDPVVQEDAPSTAEDPGAGVADSSSLRSVPSGADLPLSQPKRNATPSQVKMAGIVSDAAGNPLAGVVIQPRGRPEQAYTDFCLVNP